MSACYGQREIETKIGTGLDHGKGDGAGEKNREEDGASHGVAKTQGNYGCKHGDPSTLGCAGMGCGECGFSSSFGLMDPLTPNSGKWRPTWRFGGVMSTQNPVHQFLSASFDSINYPTALENWRLGFCVENYRKTAQRAPKSTILA